MADGTGARSLRHLREEVAAAQGRRERQLRRGEPLWVHLSTDGWEDVTALVRLIAKSHPGAFGVYAHDDDVADALIEVLDEDTAQRLESVSAVAEAVQAATSREWLVRTPLGNFMPPVAPVALGDRAVLAPAYRGDGKDSVEAQRVPASVRRLLGDSIATGARFDRLADGHLLDTRHTASLITIERGSRRVASDRAAARARYALAMWTLFSPPVGEIYMPLWPTLAQWLPQPFQHQEQTAKPFEPGRRGGSTRTSGIHVSYKEEDDAVLYRPPEGEMLAAPFEAMTRAHERRSASAVLSSAWSLYLASRLPTDLTWLDRLVCVYQARDVLCEPPDEMRRDIDARWKRGVTRMQVAAELRRLGYTTADLNAISGRGRDLRNIVVHGADAALINLGFPPDRHRRVRHRTIPGRELGPAFVQEAITPAYHAVRLLARALLVQGVETSWNDEVFESTLQP